MPFYVFEHKQKDDFHNAEGDPMPVRIVEAKNEAQATAFFIQQTTTVRKATPQDFMALAVSGGEIEKVQ
jgi:hypothetical protein